MFEVENSEIIVSSVKICVYVQDEQKVDVQK